MSVSLMDRTSCRRWVWFPVLRLAERAGLDTAAEQRVRFPEQAWSVGANPGVKITSIIAGMVTGADCITQRVCRQSHRVTKGHPKSDDGKRVRHLPRIPEVAL